MCDPVTLTIAATAVAAIGSTVSGLMTAQQERYKARVAAENSRRESARAADAIDKGAEEQRNLGRRYAQQGGAQRAALAANGVDVSFGSAADIQNDTRDFYAEDRATLDRNTGYEVKGIDISAANYTAQAQAARSAATGALVSTAFDVGSTVLGGIGKVRSQRAARNPAPEKKAA